MGEWLKMDIKKGKYIIAKCPNARDERVKQIIIGTEPNRERLYGYNYLMLFCTKCACYHSHRIDDLKSYIEWWLKMGKTLLDKEQEDIEQRIQDITWQIRSKESEKIKLDKEIQELYDIQKFLKKAKILTYKKELECD